VIKTQGKIATSLRLESQSNNQIKTNYSKSVIPLMRTAFVQAIALAQGLASFFAVFFAILKFHRHFLTNLMIINLV
jgi:hypothetical protein